MAKNVIVSHARGETIKEDKQVRGPKKKKNKNINKSCYKDKHNSIEKTKCVKSTKNENSK